MEILINNARKVILEKTGENFVVDGKTTNTEIIKVDNNQFKVFKDNRVYSVELLEKNGNEASLVINGKIVSTAIISEMEQLLKKLGMGSAASTTVKELKAPMPGTILSLSQSSGSSVVKGDPILILEAMKMENVIKSPGDGVIKTVHVSKGDNVEKNQKLISFE